jgi:hypothetical protein
VTEPRWWVRFARDRLTRPANPMAFVEDDLPDWGEQWLSDEGIAPGTPFLLSPKFEYDLELNAYFMKELVGSAPKTQEASARDLASFLTFLWRSRGGLSWRDATEDDHRAYLVWRRRDPSGPWVSGTTWDREVATVNRFYWWALKCGHVAAHPIPQRMSRRRPVGGDWNAARARDELRPATYSHDGNSERVIWLPPADYRRWRDSGIRGFAADGLPAESFRGWWAARNVLLGVHLGDIEPVGDAVDLPNSDAVLGMLHHPRVPPVVSASGSCIGDHLGAVDFEIVIQIGQ